MSSVFPILGAAIVMLGIFGFGHHFHLGTRPPSPDVLWDTENGVTKVPSFSAALTPVPDLNSSCPVTSSTGEPAGD